MYLKGGRILRSISDTMEKNIGDIRCETILDYVDINIGSIDLRLY